MCAVCCVLWFVGCMLCAVCCVMCAVCCVLWFVGCMLCAVCCVLWAVGCMLYDVPRPVFASSSPCIVVVVGIGHPCLLFDLIFRLPPYCCFVYLLHVFTFCLARFPRTPHVMCCVLCCDVCCVVCVV